EWTKKRYLKRYLKLPEPTGLKQAKSQPGQPNNEALLLCASQIGDFRDFAQSCGPVRVLELHWSYTIHNAHDNCGVAIRHTGQ
ncbi:hypothetical protein, partial [Xanthomonas arboricola]|uniref:hypothetical protein n=1 Tax=Xanthomonas arboricola TaxID=56448 RepID=UPI0035E630F4